MIIDFHSHDFPDALAPRAMRAMCRNISDILRPAGDGTLLNHLDQMAHDGVDLAVSAPIATKPQMFSGLLRRAVEIQSGALGERVRAHIIPFASVHPRDPEGLAHVKEIAAAGVRGVKFHCYYQAFSLADPELFPLFQAIADSGLVVLAHCGADVGWRNVRGYCGPEEIATLLKNVRGLKFVAAHLGGCDGYPVHATDPLLDLGAYIDTSVLHRTWHEDEKMRVLRSWPTNRILFGTDFPWANAAEAIRWVRGVRDPRDHAALFAENAKRLLRI